MTKQIGMDDELVDLINSERQKDIEKPSFSAMSRRLIKEALVQRGAMPPKSFEKPGPVGV